MASLFLYVHDYSDNVRDLASEVGFRNKFRKIYDFKAYYYKTEAPKPSDNEIDFYNLHQLAHPVVSYFNKDMPQKMSIYGINALNSYQRILFPIKDSQSFRKFINQVKPGLDLTQNVTTPSGETIQVEIGFGVEFFRPFYGL